MNDEHHRRRFWQRLYVYVTRLLVTYLSRKNGLCSGVTGLVSPEAATDGVTPSKKPTTFFIVIALCKVMTFLTVVSSQLLPSNVVIQCSF